jgi:3-methyladenine DNA glycosylase AlkC
MEMQIRILYPKLPTTCTLAVVDTKSKHTARELREILDTVLSDYDIPLGHILCCVTDNATNMVKLVSSMNDDQEASSKEQEQNISDEDGETDENDRIDEGTNDLSPSICPVLNIWGVLHTLCSWP